MKDMIKKRRAVGGQSSPGSGRSYPLAVSLTLVITPSGVVLKECRRHMPRLAAAV